MSIGSLRCRVDEPAKVACPAPQSPGWTPCCLHGFHDACGGQCVGVSYAGRNYAEGKKIGWKDGLSAFRCIVKYSISERNTRPTLHH